MTSRVNNRVSDVDFFQSQYLGDRENQEDYADMLAVGEDQSEIVAVLSDGMGGHAAGEVASQLAVKVFLDTFASLKTKSREGRLYSALQSANAEMSRRIAKEAHLEGMGCTLVGVSISKDGVSWISVGDSPLFLFRGGRLTRLNDDHSMMPVLEKLVTTGELSATELARHPQRNSLRSALTGDRLALIDSSPEPLRVKSGDVLLSASDGLLTLESSQIAKVFTSIKPFSSALACDQLIRLVREKAHPKQDNVTVQVFHFQSSSQVQRLNYARISAGAVLLATLLVAVGILVAKFSEISSAILGASTTTREVAREIQPIKIDPDLDKKVLPERAPAEQTRQPMVIKSPKPQNPTERMSEAVPAPRVNMPKDSDKAGKVSREAPQAPSGPAAESLRAPEGSVVVSPKSSVTAASKDDVRQGQSSKTDQPSSFPSAGGVGLIGGPVVSPVSPPQGGPASTGSVSPKEAK